VFRITSAIMLRAEFPVHKNKTLKDSGLMKTSLRAANRPLTRVREMVS
jgi:hypothetical protein